MSQYYRSLWRLNRPISATEALSRSASIEYDDASRPIETTDARDLVIKYFYDNVGNQTKREHWTNTTLDASYTFAFDLGNRRTQMVDGTGTASYSYDAVDRLTSVTFPGSRTVSYGYDNAGRRTSITYAGGSNQVTYAYNEANMMTSVTDWNSNQTTYAYNNAGALTTVTLPSGTGVTGNYTYDNADRLTGVDWVKSGSTLRSASYTLNPAGNRTQRVDQLGTHTYAYDALQQLLSVTYPGPTTDTYTYDANGNRLTKTGVTGGYTYDDADQMTAAGGVNYTYDDNGNLTARGNDTFAWNHENRMTSAYVGGTTTTSPTTRTACATPAPPGATR